jgi:hypothetical protein
MPLTPRYASSGPPLVIKEPANELNDFVFNPPVDFLAGTVTQVDCVPLTTAPLGVPLSGAIAGWYGYPSDVGLVVVGAQVDGIGSAIRVFILNTTGANILGVVNVLFTVMYRRAT